MQKVNLEAKGFAQQPTCICNKARFCQDGKMWLFTLHSRLEGETLRSTSVPMTPEPWLVLLCREQSGTCSSPTLAETLDRPVGKSRPDILFRDTKQTMFFYLSSLMTRKDNPKSVPLFSRTLNLTVSLQFLKNSTFLRNPSSPSAGPYGHGTFAPTKPSC